MSEENRSIFFASETSGVITSTITQATASSTLYSRQIIEDSDSVTERTLFIDAADDDASTPTIQVLISLYFDSGWSDYVEIEAASVVPKEICVTAYAESWWKKNKGVQFKFVKAGAGAVTYTNAKWI